MNKIFILNAPPQTGKDTIANSTFYMKASFKTPMFDIASKTLGLTLEDFMDKYETSGWKDTVLPELQGGTVRQLMIHISENYIKPFFGPTYFGDAVVRHIKNFEESNSVEFPWVIPDGGFPTEIEMLEKEFGDRVIVVQLEREGHRDFGVDSRTYVSGKNTVRFDTTNGNQAVLDYMKSLVG